MKFSIIKIKERHFISSTSESDRPYKAKSLNGKEFNVSPVASNYPEYEKTYYLFGFIPIYKYTYHKEVIVLKDSFTVSD
ncbi:MAG: hypothetical protein GX963_10025 [Bacteroidales bacterium]|nr:hypothetical protein [Bacteroidales bacterium]